MALETGTYISDLVVTNPAAADGLVDADNHMRLIKNTIKATFPNITGAVTPTHTELNYVDGVTSAIQTQMDLKESIANVALKADLAGPTFTGVPSAPTAAPGTNTTQVATTAFVQAAAASVVVADDSITNAKLAEVPTLTIKGNNTGGTANPVDLTSAQATAMLDVATTSLKGLVPAPSTSPVSTKYLAEDMTYVALPSSVLTLATEQAATSGTAITFSGIPAGIKRITVMFDGVSTTSVSPIMIQIGDAGGLEATGYDSGAGNINTSAAADSDVATTGFVVTFSNTGAGLYSGMVTLCLQDAANTWVASGIINGNTTPATIHYCAGKKQLSAELTQVSVTTVGGANTFDAGSLNISYE